jgi:hypothetical protein
MEIARLELATFRLSVECSNQLSYISKQGEGVHLRGSKLPFYDVAEGTLHLSYRSLVTPLWRLSMLSA